LFTRALRSRCARLTRRTDAPPVNESGGQSMKRALAVATAATAALVVAGLAVADGVEGGKSPRAVIGAFAATTASHVTTRTCTTTTNKTVVTTEGTYTGMATGDADLTGPVTLHARSTINSTDNFGVVSGTVRIDVADRATA